MKNSIRLTLKLEGSGGLQSQEDSARASETIKFFPKNIWLNPVYV